MEIGELIRGRLEAMGRQPSDLVRELDRVGAGVTRQSVHAWLHGEARPRMRHVLALWDVLSIAPEDRDEWLAALASPREVRDGA